MKKTNVLHVISSSSFLGAERVISELCKNGNEEKFNYYVVVMSKNKDLEKVFIEAIGKNSVDVALINCKNAINLKTFLFIKNYVCSKNIEIIHSHGYKANFFSYIVSVSIGEKIFLFSTVHNWILDTKRERLYKCLDVHILRKFHKVIVVSKKLLDELMLRKFEKNIIGWVPNGVSNQEATSGYSRKKARELLSLDDSDFVVGCVASLSPVKAQEFLIEALSLLAPDFPQVMVVLIGDGERRLYLEDYARSLKVYSRIKFAGYRSDVRALYSAMDVFSLVSKDEGLPMALLEAMASGVPVVVPAVGSIPDVIGNGEYGFMFRTESVNEIADNLRLLIKNATVREEFSQKGRLRVEKSFSTEKMCRSYEEYYQNQLDSQSNK